jgi:hypothetical protein
MELPDKSGVTTPRKKVEAVIPPGSKKVERPATRRFFDFLFAESPKELGKKVARDVVVPRLKAGVEEAFNNFLAGMLWGGNQNRPLGGMVQGTVLRAGASSYSTVSTQAAMLAARGALPATSSNGSYQDLVVPTQQFAETLLANMYNLLDQYRVVAVADLYEAAALTPAPADNSYGWTSLDGARISKVREGYLLELPRPSLI